MNLLLLVQYYTCCPDAANILPEHNLSSSDALILNSDLLLHPSSLQYLQYNPPDLPKLLIWPDKSSPLKDKKSAPPPHTHTHTRRHAHTHTHTHTHTLQKQTKQKPIQSADLRVPKSSPESIRHKTRVNEPSELHSSLPVVISSGC